MTKIYKTLNKTDNPAIKYPIFSVKSQRIMQTDKTSDFSGNVSNCSSEHEEQHDEQHDEQHQQNEQNEQNHTMQNDVDARYNTTIKKNKKEKKKSNKKEKDKEKEIETETDEFNDLTKGLIFDTQNYITQYNMSEEAFMGVVEKVINKKMDTIKMIIKSAVNRRLKDSVRKATTGRFGDTSPSNYRIPSTNMSRIASTSINHVKYANFCTENYSYINMIFLCDLIKTVTDFHAILQKVVRELYFNPAHKENNIIFIHPSAFKTITVYHDDAWRNFDLQTTLVNIIRRANDVLQHYMLTSERDKENFCEEIGKKRFEALENFTDRIDNMEDLIEFRNKLLSDTEHTIVTNQMIVHPNIFEIEAPL